MQYCNYASEKKDKNGRRDLLWEEFLLDTVSDFKAEKKEHIHWESIIKYKYERIKERFIRNFPDGEKSEEYPHGVTVFTRGRIPSKIKQLPFRLYEGAKY